MTLSNLLNYGKGFQHKVLRALITSREFVLEIHDVLKPEYFDSESQRWVVETLLKYFDEYHTNISKDALKAEVEKIDNTVLQSAVKNELVKSIQASEKDIDYVKKEFSQFCRNQEMKTAIMDAAELLKRQDFDGIRKVIEDALKAGSPKDIGHDYKKDVEERYRNTRKAIAMPWDKLNDKFQGGIGNGDLAIVFGNPGGGKSWLMVAIAAYAASNGYNVNYYSLELGEEYVGKRFDSFYTKVGLKEIEAHKEVIRELSEKLKGNITIKEYPPKFASINTIKQHIQKCADDDLTPDLVVIDYLDYLKSLSKYRNAEKKDEIDDNYIAAKGLAKELQIPVISPSQVNRSGAKDDVIEGDKAAGSYDKIMVADIIISLSRKKEDKISNTGRIHIIKNRYGDDGSTYDVAFDASTGHMEILRELDESDFESSGEVKKVIEGFFENK
jgi:replicative DNA helicase